MNARDIVIAKTIEMIKAGKPPLEVATFAVDSVAKQVKALVGSGSKCCLGGDPNGCHSHCASEVHTLFLQKEPDPIHVDADWNYVESGIGGKASPTGDKGVVKTVWTIEGCIVCDLCEDIAPEVFKMVPTTVRILTENKDHWGKWSDKIIESAVGCPVNVIKYELECSKGGPGVQEMKT